MKNSVLILTLLASVFSAGAASVDTALVYSTSMKKNIKCVVIKPDSYTTHSSKRFPVVYLLHGYSGSYSDWIKKVPELKNQADRYDMMVVCPDGAFSSWYFDSPADSSMRYETHVGIEIPLYIDSHYRTIADRRARAITGLSMGGHGALYIGWRHADFFGAAGSMSGALDISRITKGLDVEKRLGDTLQYRERFLTYSFLHEMEKPARQPLAIILDCGTEDFIFQMSRQAHEKMTRLKIPHDYIERPGKHDWPYWANAVQYQLLYFHLYFKRNAVS